MVRLVKHLLYQHEDLDSVSSTHEQTGHLWQQLERDATDYVYKLAFPVLDIEPLQIKTSAYLVSGLLTVMVLYLHPAKRALVSFPFFQGINSIMGSPYSIDLIQT